MGSALQFRLPLFFVLGLLGGPLQGATITVNTDSDGVGADGLCELREAIEAANTNAVVDGCSAGDSTLSPDIISFDLATDLISLTADLPVVTQSLEIAGPGAGRLTVDGSESFAIIETPNMAGPLIIRDIRFFRGLNEEGGCVFTGANGGVVIEDAIFEACRASTGTAGGLRAFGVGSTTIRRTTFNGNRSTSIGGGAYFTNGTSVLIEDSLFLGNLAIEIARKGGAIAVSTALPTTIRRSTFFGNRAAREGSVLHQLTSAESVTMEHCTVIQNEVVGTTQFDIGAAIDAPGALTLFNTVVADNSTASTFSDITDINLGDTGSVTTLGYNFIGNNEGASSAFPAGTNANGDLVGDKDQPRNPQLGDLQDNGGPTWTALPVEGSGLIDHGSCPDEKSDQRGYGNNETGKRAIDILDIENSDDGCDIGAAEYAAAAPPLVFEDGFEDLD
jgi:CSLREA domain-containing protein